MMTITKVIADKSEIDSVDLIAPHSQRVLEKVENGERGAKIAQLKYFIFDLALGMIYLLAFSYADVNTIFTQAFSSSFRSIFANQNQRERL